MLEAIPHFYHQTRTPITADNKVAHEGNPALLSRLTLTDRPLYQIKHPRTYHHLTTTRKHLNAGFTPVMERYFSQIPYPSLYTGIHTPASRTLERCTEGLCEWLSQD